MFKRRTLMSISLSCSRDSTKSETTSHEFSPKFFHQICCWFYSGQFKALKTLVNFTDFRNFFY